MNIEFASFSEIGPRTSNQDRVLLPVVREGTRFLAAIADGIGGAAGGAEAAQIAIDVVAGFKGSPLDLSAIFADVVVKIREVAAADEALAKMGTTLTVVLIEGGVVYVAHAGDSRAYHIRGKGLNTLTKDQTEVAELMRRGVLNDRQAKRYPRRNVLLSALSAKSEYEVHLAEAAIAPGDRLLLITDGVYQRVKRGGILNLALATPSVSDFAEQLKAKVAAAEPSDNYSAVAVDIRADA